MEITLLRKKGDHQLLHYPGGYFSVDYSNESVGKTLLFTKDKEAAERTYEESVCGKSEQN